MLAGEDDPAVDLAEIVVMFSPRFLAPISRASQREWDPVPGHGDAVFEFGAVLWMYAPAKFDGARHPVRRRHRGEFVRIRALKDIGAQQYPSAASIEAVARIGDLADRQIRVADAAIDRFVLFPEPALELQPDLDGGRIGHRIDRRLHAGTHVELDLAQNGKRDRADAPVGFRRLRRSRRTGAGFGVHIADGDTAIALLNARNLRIVANEIADFPCKRLADHVHAAYRLKHGGLELMQREIPQPAPKPRLQYVGQVDGLAGDRRRTQTTPGILGVTAIIRRDQIGLVGVVAVQRAPGPQRLQQYLLVFHRHRFVE